MWGLFYSTLLWLKLLSECHDTGPMHVATRAPSGQLLARQGGK